MASALIEENSLKESVPAAQAVNLLAMIVRSIVDRPDTVTISVAHSDVGLTFTVHVHPDDVGRVIGRHGDFAKAIRIVIVGSGMKHRNRYSVVFGDPIQRP